MVDRSMELMEIFQLLIDPIQLHIQSFRRRNKKFVGCRTGLCCPPVHSRSAMMLPEEIWLAFDKYHDKTDQFVEDMLCSCFGLGPSFSEAGRSVSMSLICGTKWYI